MYKIIIKDFKHNITNYMLFFSSEIISIAMIYALSYLTLLCRQMMLREPTGSIDISMLLSSVLGIVVLSVSLMSYTIKHYISTRMKSYQLFIILGIRRNTLVLCMVVEYILGGLIGFVAGIGAGNAVTLSIKTVLNQNGLNAAELGRSADFMFGCLFLTFLCYGIIVGCNCIYLKTVLLDNRRVETEKGGNLFSYKGSKVCAMTGSILLGIGLLIRSPLINILVESVMGSNEWRLQGALMLFQRFLPGILCFIGIGLIFTQGGYVLFEYIKKKPQFYYRHILTIRGRFQNYQHTRYITFAIFAVYTLVIVYSVFIVGSMLDSVVHNFVKADNNRYDLIWVTSEEHVDPIIAIGAEHSMSAEQVPFLMMRNADSAYGDRYITISESSYAQLTDKELRLGMYDIYAISQSGGGKVIRSRNARLYQEGDHPDNAQTCHVTGEEEYVMFLHHIGDLLVVSDEFFENLAVKSSTQKLSTAQSIVMQNFTGKEQDKVIQEASTYDSSQEDVTLYCKEKMKQAETLENMTSLIVSICLCLMFVICGLFITGVKVVAETKRRREKYRFLANMGMRKRQLNNIIRQELQSAVLVPIIMAMFGFLIYEAVFLSYQGHTFGTNVWVEFNRWKLYIGIALGFYTSIQISYYLIMKIKCIKDFRHDSDL